MVWFSYSIFDYFPRITNNIVHFRTSRIGSFDLFDRRHYLQYLNHNNSWFDRITNAEISISARCVIVTNR